VFLVTKYFFFVAIFNFFVLKKNKKMKNELLPESQLPVDEWTSVEPKGLYVMKGSLLPSTTQVLKEFYATVDWFQRFGKQYPATAHHNGHHCMALDHASVHAAVKEGIEIALSQCDHTALRYMQNNMDDVSVATMLHKGAVRTKRQRGDGTKLVKEGWGLGRHPDTWAPDGQGLVLMICVANTKEHHREFMFTSPPRGLKWSVYTPDATVLVFTHDAYDTWEHESIRSKWQDGECISLTVRIKSIDSYYGWAVPDALTSALPPQKGTDLSSVKYARKMQHARIQAISNVPN